MKNWNERFKEIREKHRISQAELGRAIGKDATQVSRYERGTVKNFPNALYKLLRGTFTESEIMYIEKGVAEDVGRIEDAGEIYSNIPNDISVIMDILKDMDKKQRREVLKYAMEMEEKKDDIV